jgi:hypothetical protein
MYQHQHVSLPLDQLKGLPQPVVLLLEVLLEKDPQRRFQNPAELLKATPTITGAVDAGRIVTRPGLQKRPPAASPAVPRKESRSPHAPIRKEANEMKTLMYTV